MLQEKVAPLIPHPATSLTIVSLKEQSPAQRPSKKSQSPQNDSASPNEIVLVGDKVGNLHIFLPSGELIHTHPTGHVGAVSALFCDLANRRDPVIVTAGEDGSVRVHSLLVSWNGRVVFDVY